MAYNPYNLGFKSGGPISSMTSFGGVNDMSMPSSTKAASAITAAQNALTNAAGGNTTPPTTTPDTTAPTLTPQQIYNQSLPWYGKQDWGPSVADNAALSAKKIADAAANPTPPTYGPSGPIVPSMSFADAYPNLVNAHKEPSIQYSLVNFGGLTPEQVNQLTPDQISAVKTGIGGGTPADIFRSQRLMALGYLGLPLDTSWNFGRDISNNPIAGQTQYSFDPWTTPTNDIWANPPLVPSGGRNYAAP